jgi:hypothetical protein
MSTAPRALPRRAAPALVAVLLLAAPPAGAQQHGSVLIAKVADGDTHILPGAEVSVRGLARVVRTDSTGVFALDGIPAGEQVVLVRHPGFEPLSVTLAFSGADTLYRLFLLDHTTMPVTATADSADITADKFRDFRRRRARGLGLFMVHDDYANLYDRPLCDVLRRLPGIVFQRNQRSPGVAVASARGVTSIYARDGSDGFAPACYLQIFVDGIRVFAPNNGQNPVDINSWRTDDIEAIEYFPSPDRTPPELGGTGSVCGTLSLWLRIG